MERLINVGFGLLFVISVITLIVSLLFCIWTTPSNEVSAKIALSSVMIIIISVIGFHLTEE